MDKNKSIDGLYSRPKTITKKRATTKTTKKPAKSTKSTKPTKSAAKTTKTQVKATKPVTPVTKIEITEPVEELAPEPQTTPKTPSEVTEDFLKPVQAFDFNQESGKLEASPEKPKKLKKPKKPKKKMSKKRKIILSVIIVIVAFLTAGIIWFVIWGNDILAKITGGQGNVLDLIFMDETYKPLKTDENGRTNILAFGTSGYDMDGTAGDSVHDGAQLTDSIMVISLNQETGDLAMLSLPRDLKVTPICTATGKINEVYWCNNMENTNEQAGAEALVAEVEDILGVDLQYYTHVNWGSLISIVDILDGITVTLDEDIEDFGYTKANFKANIPYTIDGEQALGLARARHGTESGDFSRGASQQKILLGIKDKILEKTLSISELLSLASTLGDNLRTNFSIEEMKTLAHLLSEYDFNNARQISLIEPEQLMTSGMVNGISYVLPSAGIGNYTRIQNYIAKMFSSDPRKYEDSSILVLNSTETPYLASNEKESLEEDGYSNIYIDDTSPVDSTEDYLLYSLTDTAPGTKKLLESKYNTTAQSESELPADISRDFDFIIIINKSEN